MKITVEFNNLQEMDEFCSSFLIAPGLAKEAKKEEKAEVEEKPKKATKVKAEAHEPVSEEPKSEAEPAESVAQEPETVAEEPKTEAKKAQHTETELSALLADKLKEGKKSEVKDFFEGYEVTKLTELKQKIKAGEADIDEVYAKAEVI